MGILRILLAMGVIASHTHQFSSWVTLPGGYAVETFFMISGFYIGLILNEKYFRTKHPYLLFITNRILRLYPLYLVILFLSLGIYTACGGPNNPLLSYQHSEMGPAAFIILANVMIIGLDVPNFFPEIRFPAPLVPPAWSLSLEFMFYFIAPILTRLKTLYLIILMLLSLTIRLCLINHGLFRDPWSFRFFPTELIFFLLGLLAHRVYARIRLHRIPTTLLTLILFANVFLILGWYSFFRFLVPFLPWLKYPAAYPSYLILYYSVIWASLPFIFHLTREKTWDRLIGEFSYPIYLVHNPLAFTADALGFSFVHSASFPWVIFLISIIVSSILLYFIIYPMERIRHHRILSHKI